MTNISLENELEQEFSFLECFTKYVQKTDSHVLDLARSCLEEDQYRLFSLEIESCLNRFLQSRNNKDEILKKINKILETPLVESTTTYENTSIINKVPIEYIYNSFQGKILYFKEESYVPEPSSTYLGELKELKPHGKGILTHDYDEVYSGEFQNGERHGQGENTNACGEIIAKGYWKNGKMEGFGYKKNQNEEYTGEFVYGEYEGRGILTDDFSFYEGEFDGGRRHGKGSLTLKNEIYEGIWEYEHFRKGTIKYADGDVYEGTYKYGCYDEGKLIEKNGNVWEGVWNTNLVIKCTNGIVFTGNYSGFSLDGTFKYPNGDVFTGRNQKEYLDKITIVGGGEYLYSNGDIFSGSIDDRKKSGTYKYVNGDEYRGQLENDKFDGNGTLYQTNRGITTGYWKKGLIIE